MNQHSHSSRNNSFSQDWRITHNGLSTLVLVVGSYHQCQGLQSVVRHSGVIILPTLRPAPVGTGTQPQETNAMELLAVLQLFSGETIRGKGRVELVGGKAGWRTRHEGGRDGGSPCY